MSRHVEDADEMFAAICEHLEFSNNGGNIRPAITVFRQRTPGKVTCDVLHMWDVRCLNILCL